MGRVCTIASLWHHWHCTATCVSCAARTARRSAAPERAFLRGTAVALGSPSRDPSDKPERAPAGENPLPRSLHHGAARRQRAHAHHHGERLQLLAGPAEGLRGPELLRPEPERDAYGDRSDDARAAHGDRKSVV